MEWQPIETAPMDGSEVLIAFINGIRIASKSPSTGKWWSEYGHQLNTPTHWMRLPEPPK